MKISNCFFHYPKNGFKLAVPELELKENEINCLLGDNGCGKSTLLKQIMVDACEHNIPSKMMLLQRPYLFTGTVLDNLKLVKKLCPHSRIDQDKLVKDLDLTDLLAQSARSLSGGQRQRLAFGLVMLSDCDLIILDEPFNNIDLTSQRLMIKAIKKYPKTYLLVSHRIRLSRKIGDHFMLMESGQIVATGDQALFEQHEKLKLLMEMEG